MLENIAIWGGIAGIIVAFFAIIILFLTKQSIKNILSKDALLFDQNFEIKKDSITQAFQVVDELRDKGPQIKHVLDFSQRAKNAYNNLLCVVTDIRVAEEFYRIAIDLESQPSEARLVQFKLMCRKDVGLTVKNESLLKEAVAKQKQTIPTTSSFQAPPTQQIARTQPIAQPQITRPTAPAQPRPTQPRPVQPAAVKPQPVAPKPTAPKK